MKWFKEQLTLCLTLAVLAAGGLVAWGRMVEIASRVDVKADKETVDAYREATTRELRLIHDQLAAINERMDGVIIRQAVIQDARKTGSEEKL